MAHLKHAGPIRRASAAKRTALVEILSDDVAANEGGLSEADLIAIDAAEPTAAQKVAREYERALAEQVQRQGVRS